VAEHSDEQSLEASFALVAEHSEEQSLEASFVAVAEHSEEQSLEASFVAVAEHSDEQSLEATAVVVEHADVHSVAPVSRQHSEVLATFTCSALQALEQSEAG
jgi:hypothetical protein